jgi:hypothetical protein
VPVIPILRRLRQEDLVFQASIIRLSQINNQSIIKQEVQWKFAEARTFEWAL